MIFIVLFALFPNILFASHNSCDKIAFEESELRFIFEENKGQFPEQVLYKIQLTNQIVYVERSGLRWHVYDYEGTEQTTCFHQDGCNGHEKNILNHVFKMRFDGANMGSSFSASGESPHYYNYIKGNDSSKHFGHVHLYQSILIEDVYPNIDFRMYSTENGLKFDWIVYPGGDPDQIRSSFDGLEGLEQSEGDLILNHSLGFVKALKPFTYQLVDGKRIEVGSAYSLVEKRNLVYQLDPFAASEPLIIDPELVFSSYSGSFADNWGSSATPGANGELYGGGIVDGFGYPTTNGAFMFSGRNSPGRIYDWDIAIARFRSDGSRLEYATYLGGTGHELCHSLVENSKGELVVLGTTDSRDFPIGSGGAYDDTFNGGTGTREAPGADFVNGTDLIVSILSPDGARLVGGTYIGGSGNDGINDQSLSINYGDEARGEVIVDVNDNIYVASCTQSNDFPIVAGIYRARAGGQDGVVLKLDSDASNLLASTFYGGSGDDSAYGVKVASDSTIIIAGGTASRNLPMRSTIQPNYQGSSADGYIAKFNPELTELLASTFVGTNEYDQIFLIDLAEDNSIYVAGQSTGNMPQTANTYGVPNGSQFIQRYDDSLKVLVQSARFGSGRRTVDISLTAFLVDRCGRVFVSGWGGGLNDPFGSPLRGDTEGMETTSDAERGYTDGNDFYFLVLEKDMTDILYATYFGTDGEFGRDHVDGGTSRFSDDGVIYQSVCASCSGDSAFPTTPGTLSNTNNSGSCNMAVIKFDFELTDLSVLALTDVQIVDCDQSFVQFNNFSSGADRYEWHFGDGASSTEISPRHSYAYPDTFDVLLIAISDNVCIGRDTFPMKVIVSPSFDSATEDVSVCNEPVLNLVSNHIDTRSTYLWNTGDTTSQITVTQSGTYIVTTDIGFCRYIDTFNVIMEFYQSENLDTALCEATEFKIYSPIDAENISWSTGEMTDSITVMAGGMYILNYTIGACLLSDTTIISFDFVPELEILGDTVSCKGEFTNFESRLNFIPESYTTEWSTGNTSDVITVGDEGWYYVEVVVERPCFKVLRDSIYLRIIETDTGLSDTSVCVGNDLILEPSDLGSGYFWSTGETSETITVGSDGLYIVTYDVEGCPKSDSFDVIFETYPNFELIGDSVLCEGSSLKLELRASGDLTTANIRWFDNSEGMELEVNQAGVYGVNISGGLLCPYAFRDSIIVDLISALAPIPDTGFCDRPSFTVNAPDGADSYTWSTGINQNEELIITQSGIYFLNYSIGICDFRDTFEVLLDQNLIVDIIGDSLICGEDISSFLSIDQTLFNQLVSPLWSTGENDFQISVSETGYYHFSAETPSGCQLSDTFFVRYIPLIVLNDFKDTLLCGQAEVTVDLSPYFLDGVEVEWSDGFLNPIREINEAGIYYIDVNTECESYQLSADVQTSPFSFDDIPIYMPNAFTPNEDANNDVFKAEPAPDLDIQSYRMLVFDRWGNKIFESTEVELGWDGYFKGVMMDPAIFVYTVEASIVTCGKTKDIFIKGDVNLQR